jgi:hypothetical protein
MEPSVSKPVCRTDFAPLDYGLSLRTARSDRRLPPTPEISVST